MASSETILAWKAELQGAESVKDGLRKINEEVKKGSLTQTEANRVIQTATKDTRNFRAEQNLLTRSFQSAHPQLTQFSRAMSTLSGVARAGMNIATTLNTMWIRQSLNMDRVSDATYTYEKAVRDRIAAEKTDDAQKIADALENEAIALEHLGRAQKEVDNNFWVTLFDVATVTSSVATAVTTVFTQMMKNPTIYAAVMRAGSFLGGVFSGFFSLFAKLGTMISDWLLLHLTGPSPLAASAKGGSKLGTIFGLSFAGAMSVAIIAVGAAILVGAIDIMMENVSGQSFVRSLTEKLLGKGKGMSTKDILGINEHEGADLKGKGLFGGPNSYDEYIKGYDGKKQPLVKPEEIEEQVSFFQPLLDLFTVTLPTSLKTVQDGFGKGWEGITHLTNTFGAGLVSGVNDIFGSLIKSMNNAIASYNRAAKKMGKSTISSLTFSPESFKPIPMPSVKAATGFNGMINRPTMFLAGEAGPEQVSITPNGGSSNGGITVVVNVQGSILTERELFRRVDENLKNELKKRNFRLLQ